MKSYPRTLVALGIFIFVPFLLYGRVLIGRDALWGYDWINAFYPYLYSFDLRFHAGHLLVWNPQQSLGYPQFAEGQSLQLYPPYLLLVTVLPMWWAVGILLAMHLVVAAVGTYVFCLRRDLPATSATLAACVYAFSGFMTMHYPHPTVIAAVSWMPVLLAIVETAFIRKRVIPYALWAGLVLALQLLGGQQQFTLYSLLLVLAYSIFRCWNSSTRADWRLAGKAGGLMALIGVSIACLPLAATYTMLPMLYRRALPSELFMTGFSMPPENFLMWFLPHIFGTADHYMGRSLFPETNGYVTALPWLLGLTGFLLKPRDRNLGFWFGLVLVALALSITESNPLYPALAHVPVLNWFRVPARYNIWMVFGLAMLMGHSHALLLQHQNAAARQRAGRFLLLAAVLLSAVTLLANFTFCGGQHVLLALLQRQAPTTFFHAVNTRADAIFNSLAGWDSTFLLLHLVLGTVCILAILRQKPRPALYACGLGLLLVADLVRVNVALAQTITPDFFAYQPPAAVFLEQQQAQHDLFRIWTLPSDLALLRQQPHYRNLSDDWLLQATLQPKANLYFNLTHADDDPALQLLRQFNLAKALSLAPDDQFLSATDEVAKKSIVLHGLTGTARQQLLSLLNVRYIVTTQNLSDSDWRLAFNDGMRIYENQSALPRAFLVGGAQAQTPDAALRTLLSGDFKPQRVALVESNSNLGLPAQAPSDFKGQATIKQYGDTEITLEAQANTPSLLVLGDAYYPDWRVWVDGVEQPVIIADYVLRGVALTAGQHQVMYRYQPRWWGAAFAISLGAALLTVAALIITILRRDR